MSWPLIPSPNTVLVTMLVPAAIASVGLLIVAFRRRRTRGSLSIVILGVSVGVWAVGSGVGLAVTDPRVELLATTVALIGAVIAPVGWLAVALDYRNWVRSTEAENATWSRPVDGRILGLLLVVPCVTVVLALTDPANGVTPGAELLHLDVGALFATTPLGWFQLFAMYTALLVVTGTVLLFGTITETRFRTTAESVAVLIAMLAPWGVVATGIGPLAPPFAESVVGSVVGPDLLSLGLLPFGLLTSGVALAWVGVRPRPVPETHGRMSLRATVLEDLTDPVIVLDRRGRIVDCNPAAKPFFDPTITHPRGQSLLDVSEDLRPVFETDADEDLPWFSELAVDHGDGTRIYDVTVSAVDGEIGGADSVVSLRDVTDRRKNERRFREASEKSVRRFRAVTENSSDLVTIFDSNGTIIYQSPVVGDILGYGERDLVGERISEILHPSDRARIESTFDQLYENPSDVVRAEHRFRHADGSWRWVETRARNLLEDPAVNGILAISRDITERRHREQRLDVLNRLLRHNIKNEMNVVQGNAELIRAELDDEALVDRTRTIDATVEKVIDRCEKLGTAADELEEGSAEPVDIVDVLRTEVAALREEHPHAVIELDGPDSAPVEAGPGLEPAMEELLANGIEHNDKSTPSVAVSVDALDGRAQYVAIAIADNGPGIPRQEIDAISAGTETALAHGSGVGLWLVSWTIDTYGGDLEFVPTDDGTRVYIRLPMADRDGRAEVDEAKGGPE